MNFECEGIGLVRRALTEMVVSPVEPPLDRKVSNKRR